MQSHRKQKKKINYGKTISLALLLIITLVIGLVLMFNEPIKRGLVSHMAKATIEQPLNQETLNDAQLLSQNASSKNQKAQSNKQNASSKNQDAQLKKAKEKYNGFEASYDFSKVKPLSFEEVAKERARHKKVPMAGKIAIPSVQILLPIVPGVSNASLSAGAGTLKTSQQMGKGNYALASHNMNDYKTLFSPLLNIQLGAKMYITNGRTIYMYKVNTKQYISPSSIQVIDNHPGKTELTLITCNLSGNRRLLVQGTLVKKMPYNQAAQLFQ